MDRDPVELRSYGTIPPRSVVWRSSPPAQLPLLGNQALSRSVARELEAELDEESPVALSRDAVESQGAGPLDDGIAAEIDANRGRNASYLDGDFAASVQPYFDTFDVSRVPFHTNDHLCESVQANAFVSGGDVFGRQGAFDRNTRTGVARTVHELAHVEQNLEGRGGKPGHVSDPSEPHEIAAENLGQAVANALA